MVSTFNEVCEVGLDEPGFWIPKPWLKGKRSPPQNHASERYSCQHHQIGGSQNQRCTFPIRMTRLQTARSTTSTYDVNMGAFVPTSHVVDGYLKKAHKSSRFYIRLGTHHLRISEFVLCVKLRSPNRTRVAVVCESKQRTRR